MKSFQGRIGDQADTGTQKASRDYQIVAAFILIIVFEGCAGKWVNLTLEYSLIVVRDCLAITIATRALLSGKMNRYRQCYSVLTIWSMIVIIWAFAQTIINQTPAILIVIGIRFWILYAWTVMGICSLISDAEFEALCTLVLRMLLLLLPLVLLQNFSPPDSLLNRSSAGEDAFVFRIDGDVVRATGTFSFTLGYTCFIALASALALSSSEMSSVKRSSLIHIVLIVGTVLSTIVSGSRAAISYAVFLYLLATLLIACSPRARGAGYMFLGIFTAGLGILVLPYFMGDTFTALNNRFIGADEVEDLGERIQTIFFGTPAVYSATTFLGEGIGMTANLAGVVMRGEAMFLLAETEPERILLGGGLIGFLYILAKIAIAVTGIYWAMKAYAEKGNVRPALLWVTATYGLIGWPISAQLSAHAIGHLTLAFAIRSLGNEMSHCATAKYKS